MTLSPSRAFPFGMLIAAVFATWVGIQSARLAEHTPDFAWICWIVAAALAVTASRTLLNLGRLELEIGPDGVRMGDTRIPKASVTKVHRHKSLLFSGVRVDVAGGKPLDVSATHHKTDEVLQAFLKEDYPVDQLSRK